MQTVPWNAVLAIALMSLACVNEMFKKVFAILGDVDSVFIERNQIVVNYESEPVIKFLTTV